jgi:hypothetical protein
MHLSLSIYRVYISNFMLTLKRTRTVTEPRRSTVRRRLREARMTRERGKMDEDE